MSVIQTRRARTRYLERSAATEAYCDLARKVNATLTREEEAGLFARYQAGDTKAGHALVKAHLNFAVSIACSHSPRASSLDDMIQAANEGLVRALDGFNPERGRFSTYAHFWIRNRVQTWLHRSREVRPPMDTAGRCAMTSLSRTGQVDVSAIGRRRQSPDVIVAIARTAKLGRVSAESLVSRSANIEMEDPDVTVKDRLVAPRQDHDPLMQQAIDQALNELSDRERSIVIARLVDETSLATLGAQWGVSSERARQIEAAALKRLRGALAKTWDEYREAA
jgi:RNA polymerase sigma-32 factor